MDKKVKTSKLDEDNDSEHEVNKIARTAKEIQKVQIENLMKRIDKPIVLPENKGVVLKPPKDFIRNIQGIFLLLTIEMDNFQIINNYFL